MTINDYDRAISKKEFVAMSSLCKTTTHKLISTSKLRSTRVGRRRLILISSARTLIAPATSKGEE